MMNKQRGFTLAEVMMVIIGLAWLGVVCGVIYAVFHFLSKFW
jgi:prepilin-type N-terminal cleavage/methylation domain-containing protein